MAIPVGPRDATFGSTDTIRLERRNLTPARNDPEEPTPEVDGDDKPEPPRTTPSIWTRMDARAKVRNDQRTAQMRKQIEGLLEGKGGGEAILGPPGDAVFGPPGGGMFGPPGGGGVDGPPVGSIFGTPPAEGEAPVGLGGIFGAPMGQPVQHPLLSEAGHANARAALDAAAPVDPNHPYAQEKSTTRRRLSQLGIPTTNDNRIHVFDVNRQHGDAVTRTLGGETALTQGANITLDAPTDAVDAQQRAAYFTDNAGKDDPTSQDLVRKAAGSLVGSVNDMAIELGGLSMANGMAADGKKTFVNMSLGRTAEDEATPIAARMMLAEPGTKLYDEAAGILGHAPRKEEVEVDGKKGFRLDKDDLLKLKRDHVLPALEREMATPEFDEAMGDARQFLKSSADMARDNGVMVFQSAGNGFETATAAGHAELSEGVLSNVDGIFRVGATNANGPGADDDTIAPFTAAGPVDASAPGVKIPVGLDNGKAKDVDGTSFASPIMTETAYVMSGVNPNLSLQEIENLLEDPRVARDVEGTTRDGAGAVDQFAAILLAQNPTLTRDQITQIQTQLDANPNARFTIQTDGTLKTQ